MQYAAKTNRYLDYLRWREFISRARGCVNFFSNTPFAR